MAKTIFDMPALRPARSLTPFIGAVAPKPAEKEVAAEPPLQRNVVLYQEARPGIDGEAYWGACASCRNYIPEAAMRGAVRGDRCALFDAEYPVTDDSSCNAYMPNATGKPCGECQAHAGEKIIAGKRGSISPWAAGFIRDKAKRCGTCEHLDYVASKCRLLAAMNAQIPKVFEMSDDVKPTGRCTLWTEPPPPDDML